MSPTFELEHLVGEQCYTLNGRGRKWEGVSFFGIFSVKSLGNIQRFWKETSKAHKEMAGDPENDQLKEDNRAWE